MVGPDPKPEAAWFVVASPGLHEAVAQELRLVLPRADLVVSPAGVEFFAPQADVRGALPWLRVATRVWRRLGETKARAFGELERKWGALPWSAFVPRGATLKVDVTIRHCRLYHSGALKERLLAALAPHLGESTGPEVRLLVRGEHDVFQVSVDASGERLNVRGYRQEVGKAPLRETLAAGMLALCGWQPAEPLVDPMCGAGTLPIEAVLRAFQLPSTERAYAMDAWPCFVPATPKVPAPFARPSVTILGADRDPLMVERAKRNAERAQVGQAITFHSQAFESLLPPAPRGLLVFNPPYGHRLGNPKALGRQFDGIGRVLVERWAGWRVGILVPKGSTLHRSGLTLKSTQPLSNGGLPVELQQLVVRE